MGKAEYLDVAVLCRMVERCGIGIVSTIDIRTPVQQELYGRAIVVSMNGQVQGGASKAVPLSHQESCPELVCQALPKE